MISRHVLFALAPLLVLLAPAQGAPNFSVLALPVGTSPNAINQSGHIVGELVGQDGQGGFIWQAGSLVPIGTLGGRDSTATAINNVGLVTGYASLANGESHAFVYQNGVLSELAVFGQENSFGIAINDRGQVAGQYLNDEPAYRAFVTIDGAAHDLGTLGGNFAYASGINNAGQVVGVAALDDTSPFLAHAFLYHDGAMHDLGTLGGSYSHAVAINDAGQITGNAWVGGNDHAFLYENGNMHDLGTLGGRRSFARGINNSGMVVGYASLAGDLEDAAFLYAGGVLRNLNSLIDPALGWTLHSASGINDRSQIAAWGCRADQCGGVLLQLTGVVPEPGTWAMLLSGLGLIGWAGSRSRQIKGLKCCTRPAFFFSVMSPTSQACSWFRFFST